MLMSDLAMLNKLTEPDPAGSWFLYSGIFSCAYLKGDEMSVMMLFCCRTRELVRFVTTLVYARALCGWMLVEPSFFIYLLLIIT